MEDIRQIVTDIVQTIKIIVETIVSDTERKKSFKKLFPMINFKYADKMKKYRSFNLDLFDNTDEYYKDLYQYFSFHLDYFQDNELKEIIKFNTPFPTINFSLLTDLLLDILKSDEESYKTDIIKCDITSLCEIFAKKNARLIYSNTFFQIFINEIK